MRKHDRRRWEGEEREAEEGDIEDQEGPRREGTVGRRRRKMKSEEGAIIIALVLVLVLVLVITIVIIIITISWYTLGRVPFCVEEDSR